MGSVWVVHADMAIPMQSRIMIENFILAIVFEFINSSTNTD